MQTTRALRVFLVEDNPDHAKLIAYRLERLHPPPQELRHASSFSEAAEAIQSSSFDVVLLDLRLPDSGLDETLPRMTAAAPDAPIIVLTSLEDFDFAVDLVKQGAQDYIVKSDVSTELLSRSIYYAIERKRIQRDLQHYAAELERTNRELDQFTRVVSHDLKSPLAVIRMELTTLEKQCSTEAPTWGEQIRATIETVDHMRRLIDDLLRYARSTEDEAEMEPVDCDELLQRVLAMPAIDSAGARITCDPLPKIWGNPTRLVQLFQNLIENAIKYHGDRPPHVHVSAEFHGPDWVFSVEDHGIGIAAEDRHRVFEAFTRLHGQELPGTGLGLSICKRVVESHGGRIWLDSEPGRGTTFFFNLPSQPPDSGLHATPPHGTAAASQRLARTLGERAQVQ